MNIQDYVDIENEQAWVSFDFENMHVKWDLEIDGDWLDPDIFLKFNELIKDQTDNRLVIATLGQDCLLAYLDKEQLKGINKLVPYKFKLCLE